MASEDNIQKVSIPANTDLSASQYCFVTVNSSGRLALTADAGEADGVLQDKPDAAGRVGSLGISGVTKVKLGGTVTAGDDVASGASGVAVIAATGDVVNGRALESGTSGTIISILLKAAGHNALA